MELRPICYLDVGGVVYYMPAMMRYQSRPQNELRPHLIAFLKTIHDCGYELRLLSGDPAAARALTVVLAELFYEDFPHWDLKRRHLPNVYGDDSYANETTGETRVGANKAAYVDTGRPFIWIEDQMSERDLAFLCERGWIDRLCVVDPLKPDELLRVDEWIRKHRLSQVPSAS